MWLLVFIFTLLLFTKAASLYAQFRNYPSDQISQTDLPLTPDLFLPQINPADHSSGTDLKIRFLEIRASQNLFLPVSDFPANKFDFDFRNASLSAYPDTVNEHNNAVRRQIPHAEPTRQERKSPILFRFN